MGSDDETGAVSLVFDSERVWVAGETIQGEVELYFPALLHENVAEVHVKLRGSIRTSVTRQFGKRSITRHGDVSLIDQTTSLWRKDDPVYPPNGSETLRLPFTFTLPQALPPSFDASGIEWDGAVGYSLEAVAERPGVRFDRRDYAALLVIPSDAQGASLSSMLSAGPWGGPWTSIQQKKEMRRGMWGDYSTVYATLFLPEIEAFPTSTPIPFHLNVVTISKTMKRDEVEEDDVIFPPIPLLHKHLEFELSQSVSVNAQGFSSDDSDSVAYLGGMAEDQDSEFYKDVQVLPTEKVWMPSADPHEARKHKGSWKQEVTFRSFIRLTCPPTFQTDNLSVEYNATLTIKFQGIGNDVELEVPMRVVSSVAPRQPSQIWHGPSPELELPSSYFENVSAEGWHDERAPQAERPLYPEY